MSKTRVIPVNDKTFVSLKSVKNAFEKMLNAQLDWSNFFKYSISKAIQKIEEETEHPFSITGIEVEKV